MMKVQLIGTHSGPSRHRSAGVVPFVSRWARVACAAGAAVFVAALSPGCDNEEPAKKTPKVGEEEPVADDGIEFLSPTDHLIRASMVLRGIRPSVDELRAVHDDPSKIEGFVDEYVQSEQFVTVMKDLHAELLLVRTDTNPVLPAVGALDGYGSGDIYTSTAEGPLKLVEHIVANDLPYTEVVAAEYSMTNEVLSKMYGMEWDPDGPEWQVSKWADGRPHAGLLSDSQLWRRHLSNGSNFHRGRANFASTAFLCTSFADRDVNVEGGIDISDEAAVANAVVSIPTCIGCHQALDPLAAFWWGYKNKVDRQATIRAHTSGCGYEWAGADPPLALYPPKDFCYPYTFYTVHEEDYWDFWGLRPPAYFGVPADGMTDMGRMMSEDPRFSQCAAKNFFSYFAQVEREEVPLDLATDLDAEFVDSGYNAKSLAKAVVLSDAFRASRAVTEEATEDVPGMLTLRPERMDSVIEDLTGFRWLSFMNGPGCVEEDSCWGDINLLRSDRFGFRAMAGGIDSVSVTRPTHGATPVRVLVLGKVAGEAAGSVVDSDFSLDRSERRLLTSIDNGTLEEELVRQQLVDLHLRILGNFVETDSPEIDLSYQLFDIVAGDEPTDTSVAWKTTIAALLQDPEMMFF